MACSVSFDWPFDEDFNDGEGAARRALLDQLRVRHPERFEQDDDGFMRYSVVPAPVIGDDRDYLLFSTLTGTVRRYRNTRWITDEPRGLPPDVTRLVALEHEEWGADAHSATHFTARELLDWPGWNAVEFVSLEAAERWLRGDPQPFSWPVRSDPPRGATIVSIPFAAQDGDLQARRAGFEALVRATPDPEVQRRTFVRLPWDTSRRAETNPRFHALVEFWARHFRPDTVRFVTWFDN